MSAIPSTTTSSGTNPNGATSVTLNVNEIPTSVETSAPPWSYALSGTLRSGSTTPPNQLTPPNLLLLDTSSGCNSLQVTAATLGVYTTSGGSNVPSTGYVNCASHGPNYAITNSFFGGITGTLYTPNGASEYNCGGFCFTNPTVVQNPAGTQPNPLANLTSPGQNALWLASQQLKTFTATSPGCGTSSHIAYNANAFFGQQGFADNPTGVYCPDLGPGIYQGVTLWLNNAQNNLGTGYPAGPYILQRDDHRRPDRLLPGQQQSAPEREAETGTLLDLEGDSIQADGSFSGASYSFSVAVGGPYSGISIFQPPTNATPLSLNLNGTLTTDGLVYVPGATVQATAQFFGGTAILNSLIAKDLTLLISFDVQIGGLALPGPTVASPLYPNFLGQGATNRNIVGTGTNFETGAQVAFGSGGGSNGVVVNSVTVNSPTQLTANVTILPNATVGFMPVTVTNPDGTRPPALATRSRSWQPRRSPLSSNSSGFAALGLGATNQTLTVTGTGFLAPNLAGLNASTNPASGATPDPGATVVFSNAGVTLNSVTVNSATSMTLSVSVSAGATTGAGTATVDNRDSGTTANTPFTVDPLAVVQTIAPTTMPQGKSNQTVTVTGFEFPSDATLSFSGTGIMVNSEVSTAPAPDHRQHLDQLRAPPTARDVIVNNNDGGTPGVLRAGSPSSPRRQ